MIRAAALLISEFCLFALLGALATPARATGPGVIACERTSLAYQVAMKDLDQLVREGMRLSRDPWSNKIPAGAGPEKKAAEFYTKGCMEMAYDPPRWEAAANSKRLAGGKFRNAGKNFEADRAFTESAEANLAAAKTGKYSSAGVKELNERAMTAYTQAGNSERVVALLKTLLDTRAMSGEGLASFVKDRAGEVSRLRSEYSESAKRAARVGLAVAQEALTPKYRNLLYGNHGESDMRREERAFQDFLNSHP